VKVMIERPMIRPLLNDRRTYALLLAFSFTLIVYARLQHHTLLGVFASVVWFGCTLWALTHNRREGQPTWRLLVPLDRATYAVCLLIALSVLVDVGLFVRG
jgi:hypothetical protein